MCCVIICWWPSRALGVEARGEAASVGGGEEGFPPIFECAPVVGSGVAGWLVGVHEPDCGGEGDRVFDGVAALAGIGGDTLAEGTFVALGLKPVVKNHPPQAAANALPGCRRNTSRQQHENQHRGN
jgi:hypothetical protein